MSQVTKRTCSEPGCDRDVKSKGLCQRHYQRIWSAMKAKERGRKTLPANTAPRVASLIEPVPTGADSKPELPPGRKRLSPGKSDSPTWARRAIFGRVEKSDWDAFLAAHRLFGTDVRDTLAEWIGKYVRDVRVRLSKA